MLKLFKKTFPYLLIISLVITSSLFLWLPFLLKIPSLFGLTIPNSSFQYVYKNYDGPLYVVVAKTFYKIGLIENLKLEFNIPPIYFAAHLPLYPLIIRFFAPISGYPKSTVLTNLFFSIALASFFYFFVKSHNLSKKPLLLSVVFLFLPRFLVVRSIGAPESLFIFLILVSLYFFEKGRYFLAGIFGGLATATKTPGLLLFFAFSLVFLENCLTLKKINWKSLGVFIIPLSLLVVFFLYFKQYSDFWAYFHSGDNIHLIFPFSVFNFQKNWVGTAWLEDIIFYFFLYALTAITLKKSLLRSVFYFTLVSFIVITFVQHRDISRYSLPLWPFSCIAFEKFFTSKKFLIILVILLPAIYFYGWSFLTFNIMPISDWRPFL